VARGAVVSLQQIWTLAGPWYADRLDLDWAPKTADTMARMLTAAGLTGEFWSVA
jgi:hypothetical protein